MQTNAGIRVTLATIHAHEWFLPLALMYLRAMLVERRVLDDNDVVIAELAQDASVAQMADMVLATEPNVVGLSCYVWNVERLLALSRELRVRRPELLIVLGGPEVGPVGPAIIGREPQVDVVVVSEGEVPFHDLVVALQSGTPLAGVAGIVYRDRTTGLAVTSPPAAIVKDLNDLPSPHQARFADYRHRSVAVETQRGCVFRCNFCFYNKDLSIRNRRFELERVKAEIQYWLDRDILDLYLMDPVFNLNANRAKEICRFLIEHNTRGVPVHAEVWAEFVDDELAHLMAKAGVAYVEVGLQTISEDVLTTVERRLRMEPFLNGLAAMQKHGLHFELQLIYGLPGETVETFRRSLDFAAALSPPKLSIFRLMVLPGTELWNKAESLGLQFDSRPPYFIQSHPSMPESDINIGKRWISAQRRFRKSATVRLLSRWPGVGLSRVLDGWVAWSSQRPGQDDAEDATAFLREFCRDAGVPSAFSSPLISRDATAAFGAIRKWREAGEA